MMLSRNPFRLSPCLLPGLIICLSLAIFPGKASAQTTTVTAQTPHADQTRKTTAGLTVSPDGVLLLHGKPFRGIGVNVFSALYRMLDKKDTSYRTDFEWLKARHIPFIRFMGCGYWPIQWKLYQENKAEYFARFDTFVHDAEQARIGLIPSLFWQINTIPDLVGEPRSAWGNPSSKTIAFMRTYTKEVVSRYKDSPAVWGWEFGNELSLEVDLKDTLPPVAPSLGTPSKRTGADKLTTKDLKVALAEFAKTVRSIDPYRMITSGNSQPRPDALRRSGNTSRLQKLIAGSTDSIDDYIKIIGVQNPRPLDTLSIHLYPNQEFLSFSNEIPDGAKLDDILRVSMDASRKYHMPLFVGEFGVGRSEPDKVQAKFAEFLVSIRKRRVPLSAVWVFDYPPQDKDWNITPDNGRQYQVDRIGEMNQWIQAEDSFDEKGLSNLVRSWYPTLPVPPEGFTFATPPEKIGDKPTTTDMWLAGLKDAWFQETSPVRKSLLRDYLGKQARAHYADWMLDDLTAGTTASRVEIRSGKPPKILELTSLQDFPDFPSSGKAGYRNHLPRIFRRVGPSDFECWTTSSGYLFDHSGKLLRKVQVKRKDGNGREWFGAFLETGAWCTTDIWETDRQLHIFSPSDKWLRSIHTTCTVAWARADKSGTRWIVRSSTAECGNWLLRVSQSGNDEPIRELSDDDLDWRELGPIRTIGTTVHTLHDDSGKMTMDYFTAGHGRGAMFGTQELYRDAQIEYGFPGPGLHPHLPIFSQTIYNASSSYGFFPDSLSSWVFAWGNTIRTWIIKSNGQVTGWIQGSELGDGTHKHSLLFLTEKGEVLEIRDNGEPLGSRLFQLSGKPALPAWILDAWHIGFFDVDGRLILARWSESQ